ncbi:unnamed protein product [Penicillium salamii]|nr:unnamed protein product [Penicillium salamii]
MTAISSFSESYLNPVNSVSQKYYQHRLQIYTKITIRPENYDSIVAYLFGIAELGPFLEFYTCPQPNAFACVDHQRREIAYRKRLHAAADGRPESRPPLIAKDAASRGFQILEPAGSCMFLISDSYLAGHSREVANQLGTGPSQSISVEGFLPRYKKSNWNIGCRISMGI